MMFVCFEGLYPLRVEPLQYLYLEVQTVCGM